MEVQVVEVVVVLEKVKLQQILILLVHLVAPAGLPVSAQTYPITVGAGGAGAPSAPPL